MQSEWTRAQRAMIPASCFSSARCAGLVRGRVFALPAGTVVFDAIQTPAQLAEPAAGQLLARNSA
jgi:hypothetical protein